MQMWTWQQFLFPNNNSWRLVNRSETSRPELLWCERGDSNPHVLAGTIIEIIVIVPGTALPTWVTSPRNSSAKQCLARLCDYDYDLARLRELMKHSSLMCLCDRKNRMILPNE
jgi:hypothetical protein